MPYAGGVFEQYYQASARIAAPLDALVEALRRFTRSRMGGWSEVLRPQPDGQGGWLAQYSRLVESVPVVPNDLASRALRGIAAAQGRPPPTVPVTYHYLVRFMFQPDPLGVVTVSHMTIETIDREGRFGDRIGAQQEVPSMPYGVGAVGLEFVGMIEATARAAGS